MPDVATSRTRDVTISGTGSFGVDSLSTFGGPTIFFRLLWTSYSSVSYWGKSIFVTLSVADGGATPAITLDMFYGGFTKSVTVAGTFHTGATFQANQDAGTFGFSEVVHCVQHVNPVPYEVRTGVSFTCSASISVGFTDTTNGGGSQTVSASLTMTDADIAGFASEGYIGYDYGYGFSGIPVHFDLASTIGFDSPGLISAYSGINTSYGKPQLTGNGSAVTWHWNGATSDVNPGWGGQPGYAQPGAGIQFYPSWAMSVESKIYHYADQSEVGATIDHYYGTDLVGSFASGSTYRYPASGLIDYANLAGLDPGQQRDGAGFQPGSPVPSDSNYNSLGGLIGGTYSPVGLLLQKPGDPIGAETQFRVNPTWANGYATYIRDPLHPVPGPGLASKVLEPYQQGTIEWATTHRFGLFEVGGASTLLTAPLGFTDVDLHVVSSAGFVAGDLADVGPSSGAFTVTVASVSTGVITMTSAGLTFPTGTPVVKHGSRWVADSSGPSFPGVTTPWDASPQISLVSGAGIDGNAFQVQSAGPALVGTSLRYLLKHQGFRYAHLRVNASPPSTTLTANVSAGDTDLPVASESGFHIGDHVTLGAETLTISAVSAGHLTVSPLGTGHSSGDAVTRTGASRVLFSLTGSSTESVAWLITPPADGSWVTIDLDLAKPQYKLPGTTWLPATDLYPPSLFFPDGNPFGILGAQAAVLPLDAGTFQFDYLEGYRKTDGTRTPILYFPFLDGRGDLKFMGEYDDVDLINPDVADPLQVMTWVVNGVRGASIAILPGVHFSVTSAWQHLFDTLDTVANDTGINVVIGTLGDPDPLMVFSPVGAGQFNFDLLTGYGLKPAAGAAFVVHGQLRSTVDAYYGAGDLMSASGGYDPVVGFHGDWLFDGEAIISMSGDLSGPPVVTLADNDTGAAISSGSPDDDGMVRLPAKYGVVYPYDNVTGAAQWSPLPAPPDPASYTTLGKLLNADWLKATNVSDPEDGSGYVEVGSPLARTTLTILDRYQTFRQLHGEPPVKGVDLTTTLVGVHIVCNLANRPVVKTTRDAARTWEMADLLDPCDADSVPTIARDRRDVLYVWDHTTVAGTPDAVLFRSTNYGTDWEHLGSRIEGIKYPRMANGLTRHFLCGHNGDTLVIYGSTAEAMGLGDWDILSTVAAPMQLVGFRADRRGRLHLVYVDTLGTIVQRISDEGINWTDPAVAVEAASTKPASAFALEKGVVILWTGTTLNSQPIKANLLDPDGAPVDTTITLPLQYIGLEADRREDYWLAGQQTGATLLVAHSRSGTEWIVLP